MNATAELMMRGSIHAARVAAAENGVRGMRAQVRRDESELIAITEHMPAHPEEWEGPCWCAECRSYA